MVEIVPRHRFETPVAGAALDRPAKKAKSPKQKKEKDPQTKQAKAERKERKIREGNFSQALFVLGVTQDGDKQAVTLKLGNEDYQMSDIVKCAKFRVKTSKKDVAEGEDFVKAEFVEVALDEAGKFVFPVEAADAKKVNIVLDFQDDHFSFTGGKTFKRMSHKLAGKDGKAFTGIRKVRWQTAEQKAASDAAKQ